MLGLILRVLVVGAALALIAVPLLRAAQRLMGTASRSRVWLAREGLVEETAQAVLLFPWSKVTSFDKTELHGRTAIRIWLAEDPDLQFRLLNVRVPASKHDALVKDRVEELERSRYWTSAQLVLRQANVDEPMDSFFGRLRSLAEDPGATDALPSVLDDPDPLDLDALGIGGREPTQELD